MASIPRPSVADGLDVGALQGRSRSAFHDAPYLNVNDYSSVGAALRDSASGSGAAYIPSGTTISTSDRIHVTSAMDGATLVGDGPDSVIDAGDWTGFHLKDSNSALSNITLANFRITANGNYGIRKADTGHADTGIVYNNLWTQNAARANIRSDGPGTTMQNISAWNAGQHHGIGGWNNPPNDSPRSQILRCLCWDNPGYGIDASEGSWVIDGCLVTQNGTTDSGGMKTSTNTNHTTIRNTVSIDNNWKGFNMTGQAQNLELDNCLFKGNPRHGALFANSSSVTIGTLYVFDSGYHNVVVRDGTNVNASRIETCGANQRGIAVDSGSGSIDTVVASGNGGGLDTGGISVGDVVNQQCTSVTPEDIIGRSGVRPSEAVSGGVEELTVRPE